MQIASFLPHYQLVCISFDISSFSLISYVAISCHLHRNRQPFTAESLPFTRQSLTLYIVIVSPLHRNHQPFTS